MDFFPTPAENDAFTAWKAQVLDATSHGWLPSDTYLLRLYTEGTRDYHRVAYDADRDYEESEWEDAADFDDDPERFSLYPWEG